MRPFAQRRGLTPGDPAVLSLARESHIGEQAKDRGWQNVLDRIIRKQISFFPFFFFFFLLCNYNLEMDL